MKVRIYISGPMTGYPEFNYPTFREAEERLQDKFEVVSPAHIVKQKHYKDYLREALRLLIMCDAIYMLKKWEQSTGASLEYKVALALEMKVYFEK